jgi:hypothetical protein
MMAVWAKRPCDISVLCIHIDRGWVTAVWLVGVILSPLKEISTERTTPFRNRVFLTSDVEFMSISFVIVCFYSNIADSNEIIGSRILATVMFLSWNRICTINYLN